MSEMQCADIHKSLQSLKHNRSPKGRRRLVPQLWRHCRPRNGVKHMQHREALAHQAAMRASPSEYIDYDSCTNSQVMHLSSLCQADTVQLRRACYMSLRLGCC